MPYQSMVIRIPEPCWKQVDDFYMHYRQIMKLSGFPNLEAAKLNAIAEIIEGYKNQSKPSEDWIKCNELIQELEEKWRVHKNQVIIRKENILRTYR